MKPREHHPHALPDDDREGVDRGRVHSRIVRQRENELDQRDRGEQRHETEPHQHVAVFCPCSSATALDSTTSSRKAKMPASTASGRPSATCLDRSEHAGDADHAAVEDREDEERARDRGRVVSMARDANANLRGAVKPPLPDAACRSAGPGSGRVPATANRSLHPFVAGAPILRPGLAVGTFFTALSASIARRTGVRAHTSRTARRSVGRAWRLASTGHDARRASQPPPAHGLAGVTTAAGLAIPPRHCARILVPGLGRRDRLRGLRCLIFGAAHLHRIVGRECRAGGGAADHHRGRDRIIVNASIIAVLPRRARSRRMARRPRRIR